MFYLFILYFYVVLHFGSSCSIKTGRYFTCVLTLSRQLKTNLDKFLVFVVQVSVNYSFEY